MGKRWGVPVGAMRCVGAVLRRPHLWLTALRVGRRMIRRRWWRRPPFLPVPSASYVRFRLVTMYGGTGTGPVHPDDVVTWLEWCRRWPEASR